MELTRSQKSFINKVEENNEVLNRALIHGNWGTGKSHILNYINERNIMKNNDQILIVDTWKYEGLEVEEMIVRALIEINCTAYELNNALKHMKKLISQGVLKKVNIKIDEKTGINIKKISECAKNKSLNEFLKGYTTLMSAPIVDICKTMDVKYIVFDELDRTKPDTMFEVLKFYKYFDHKDLYLSCCMNKKESIAILKHMYGNDYSAEAYFDKLFINEFEINKNKREIREALRLAMIEHGIIPEIFKKSQSSFFCRFFVGIAKLEGIKLSDFISLFPNEMIFQSYDNIDLQKIQDKLIEIHPDYEEYYLKTLAEKISEVNYFMYDFNIKESEINEKYKLLDNFLSIFRSESYGKKILVDLLETMIEQEENIVESNLRYASVYELNLREINNIVVVIKNLSSHPDLTKLGYEAMFDLCQLKVHNPILYGKLMNVTTSEEYNLVKKTYLKSTEFSEFEDYNFFFHA